MTQDESTKQALIAAPSIGAIIIGWLDVPIATWSLRIGIAFILLQFAHKVWQWRNEHNDRKRKHRRKPLPETGPGDLC